MKALRAYDLEWQVNIMRSNNFTRSTIRVRLTAIVVIFTLLLMLIFAVMTFSMFADEQRQSVLQSTEFNLQLAAGVSSQSFEHIDALTTWSMGASAVTNYMRTGKNGTSAYTAINEQWQMNASHAFVNRIIVSDGDTRLLQTGAQVTSAIPVPLYTSYTELAKIADETQGTRMFYGNDIISRIETPSIIILRSFPLPNNKTGVVYTAVSPDIITEPIENYIVPEGDALYLYTGDDAWRLDDNSFDLLENDYYTKDKDESKTLYSKTRMYSAHTNDGESVTVVSYPLENTDGWYLTHVLSESRFKILGGKYFIIISITLLLVAALGLSLVIYLSKTFSLPVEHLRGRLKKISGGDFSCDKSIEWNNELGDVGRGINSLSQSVQELMHTRVENEKEKKDLEYQMLQNQVNPHFIYNTLNSIKWMATIQNATGIAEMTTAFAHLLKSVAKGSEALIPLREEFALLNDYCTIQQYRYGGSITLDIADITDERLCECLIPRFTLQPLAENAIFHGIEPNGGIGSVWLHISAENGELKIVMVDNGVGMSSDTIKRIFEEEEKETADKNARKYKQIGVRNVHRRLQYAFGEKYGLSVESEEGKFTRMIITIPQTYADKKEDGDV